jgi:hypothetical protein
MENCATPARSGQKDMVLSSQTKVSCIDAAQKQIAHPHTHIHTHAMRMRLSQTCQTCQTEPIKRTDSGHAGGDNVLFHINGAGNQKVKDLSQGQTVQYTHGVFKGRTCAEHVVPITGVRPPALVLNVTVCVCVIVSLCACVPGVCLCLCLRHTFTSCSRSSSCVTLVILPQRGVSSLHSSLSCSSEVKVERYVLS